MPETAAPTAPTKRTITLTFGDTDSDLYDSIVADAKNDRRTPSQSLLIYLVNNYGSETK